MFKFIARMWNAVVDFFFGKKEEAKTTATQEEPVVAPQSEPIDPFWTEEPETVTIDVAVEEIKVELMTVQNKTEEEAEAIIAKFKTLALWDNFHPATVTRRLLDGCKEEIKEGAVTYGVISAIFGDYTYYDAGNEKYYFWLG